MRVEYAIIFVSDMERSILFYRDVLGLPLRLETSHWFEFETEGATLALHKSDDPQPDTGDSELQPAGRCRPGLQVANLDEFHGWMVENNVPCTQEPSVRFGAKLAQYVDPDGLVMSVGEARSN